MRSTVPGNKLQHSIQRQEHRGYVPDPHARLQLECLIQVVYDQERLKEVTPPLRIQEQLKKFPGSLWAQVVVDSGQIYHLPFKEPEDQIFMTYGNASQMEGRLAIIEYQNRNIGRGQVLLQKNIYDKAINLVDASTTYDIGSLL